MEQGITQALILIGGKASRLRQGHISINTTKAFICLQGKPLLYWNLRILHSTGIRKLVIAGDKVTYLNKARHIINDLPCNFNRVDYFQDEGLGVHGIPYELRYLLDEFFLFECGHSLNRPSHYRRLMTHTMVPTVIFSAYKPHLSNRRQPVKLARGRVHYDPINGNRVIAHPIVASQSYVRRLATLKFSIDQIIRTFSNEQKLTFLMSPTPPEFDVKEEMLLAFQSYEKIITKFT